MADSLQCQELSNLVRLPTWLCFYYADTKVSDTTEPYIPLDYLRRWVKFKIWIEEVKKQKVPSLKT
jgi:hypothetical protein